MERDEWRIDDVFQLDTLDLWILVLDLGKMPEDEASEAIAGGISFMVVYRADFDFFFKDEWTAL